MPGRRLPVVLLSICALVALGATSVPYPVAASPQNGATSRPVVLDLSRPEVRQNLDRTLARAARPLTLLRNVFHAIDAAPDDVAARERFYAAHREALRAGKALDALIARYRPTPRLQPLSAAGEAYGQFTSSLATAHLAVVSGRPRSESIASAALQAERAAAALENAKRLLLTAAD